VYIKKWKKTSILADICIPITTPLLKKKKQKQKQKDQPSPKIKPMRKKKKKWSKDQELEHSNIKRTGEEETARQTKKGNPVGRRTSKSVQCPKSHMKA
jgi:hypothetical protein